MLALAYSPNLSAQVTSPPAFAYSNKENVSARELFRGLSGSVLTVSAATAPKPKQGSGVVIGEIFSVRDAELQPLIVTNAHVVSGAASIQVRSSEGSSSAEIAYIDNSIDLAFLRLKSLPGLRRVAIAAVNTISVGDQVFALGSPRGLELSLSSGIVSSLRNSSRYTLVQTTAPISPGSSGGGLFNQRGQLVGVTSSKVVDGENLNFAIEAEIVHKLYQSMRASQALLVAVLFAAPEIKARYTALPNGIDIVAWMSRAVDRESGRPIYALVLEKTAPESQGSELDGFLRGLLERLKNEAS